ncbi:hypothetical protein ACRRTK_012132 [Alexandromys fortis]
MQFLGAVPQLPVPQVSPRSCPVQVETIILKGVEQLEQVKELRGAQCPRVPTSQRVRTRAPVSSQTQTWLYYFSPSPACAVVMATVKLTFLSHLLTDKDVSSASYNLSSATTGSYYSCVSQITIDGIHITFPWSVPKFPVQKPAEARLAQWMGAGSWGYDVAGPVAIGLTHWKNPYVQGRPTLPSDLPLFLSKDAGIPVYHPSFSRKADLATPLSCPASLSITPVPSYSSSSQETLSQDTTAYRDPDTFQIDAKGNTEKLNFQRLDAFNHDPATRATDEVWDAE